MKLDPKKYVPILKWKRAEQSALKDMTDARKDVIMPLIELVMPKPKKATAETYHDEAIALLTDKKIDEYVNNIDKSWGNRPLFVDFTWIYPEVAAVTAERTINAAQDIGLHVVPVVNMSATANLKEVLLRKRDEFNLDIALRISTVDLDNISGLNSQLHTYLGLPGSKAASTHIVVDFKDIDSDSNYMKYTEKAQQIIKLYEWKSFVLASGAFPMDLSLYKRDRDERIPRHDWLRWSNLATGQLQRMPVFADYGIRHPIYNESHLILPPTASIKYTREDEWQLLKGRQKSFGDYLASASALSSMEDFYGADYSKGDHYIVEKAAHFPVWAKIKADEDEKKGSGVEIKKSKATGTGSTETWLNAAFNHHMSVAADQVSS